MTKSPNYISKTPNELSIKRDLQAIIDNRVDGASAIELSTYESIFNIINNNVLRESDRVKLLSKSVAKIRFRFSAMANIVNLCCFLQRNINTIESLSSKLADYKKSVEDSRKATVEKASEVICGFNSIFTLSNSSMVREAISKAYRIGWHGKVYIIESRPKCEGTLLAGILSNRGIDVFLGVDMMMGKFVAESIAVILGSDAVTESFFVNKIGSALAIDIATTYKKSIIILSDKSKLISSKSYSLGREPNPANEISRNKRIKVTNPYFEKVEPSGKFKYIIGHKLFSPKQISGIITE